MNYCPKCGSQLPLDTEKFCPSCGKELSIPKSHDFEIICPDCGKVFHETIPTECPSCGCPSNLFMQHKKWRISKNSSTQNKSVFSIVIVVMAIAGIMGLIGYLVYNKDWISESHNSNYEKEYSPQTIEDKIYSYHDDYAVFKANYTVNDEQMWAVFLRDEGMIVFVLSNNIHKYVNLSLRYEYEIRDSKLRFYNGFERVTAIKENHYPETSAEICSNETGVSFYNMKRFGNRQNIHISATLTDKDFPEEGLAFIKKFAHY